MGWESGCFPASVMMTWTGLWPSEELQQQVLEKIQGKASGESRSKKNKGAISNEKNPHTLSNTHNITVLVRVWVKVGYFLVRRIHRFGTEPNHQTMLNQLEHPLTSYSVT